MYEENGLVIRLFMKENRTLVPSSSALRHSSGCNGQINYSKGGCEVQTQDAPVPSSSALSRRSRSDSNIQHQFDHKEETITIKAIEMNERYEYHFVYRFPTGAEERGTTRSELVRNNR